jgi:hypothetical protein
MKPANWTDEDTETLRQLYGTTRCFAIAKLLGRTEAAIYIRAHFLGLTNAALAPRRTRKKRDFCKRGHRLTPDNLYIKTRPNGSTDRQCKACYREWPSTKNPSRRTRA